MFDASSPPILAGCATVCLGDYVSERYTKPGGGRLYKMALLVGQISRPSMCCNTQVEVSDSSSPPAELSSSD